MSVPVSGSSGVAATAISSSGGVDSSSATVTVPTFPSGLPAGSPPATVSQTPVPVGGTTPAAAATTASQATATSGAAGESEFNKSLGAAHDTFFRYYASHGVANPEEKAKHVLSMMLRRFYGPAELAKLSDENIAFVTAKVEELDSIRGETYIFKDAAKIQEQYENVQKQLEEKLPGCRISDKAVPVSYTFDRGMDEWEKKHVGGKPIDYYRDFVATLCANAKGADLKGEQIEHPNKQLMINCSAEFSRFACDPTKSYYLVGEGETPISEEKASKMLAGIKDTELYKRLHAQGKSDKSIIDEIIAEMLRQGTITDKEILDFCNKGSWLSKFGRAIGSLFEDESFSTKLNNFFTSPSGFAGVVKSKPLDANETLSAYFQRVKTDLGSAWTSNFKTSPESRHDPGADDISRSVVKPTDASGKAVEGAEASSVSDYLTQQTRDPSFATKFEKLKTDATSGVDYKEKRAAFLQILSSSPVDGNTLTRAFAALTGQTLTGNADPAHEASILLSAAYDYFHENMSLSDIIKFSEDRRKTSAPAASPAFDPRSLLGEH